MLCTMGTVPELCSGIRVRKRFPSGTGGCNSVGSLQSAIYLVLKI